MSCGFRDKNVHPRKPTTNDPIGVPVIVDLEQTGRHNESIGDGHNWVAGGIPSEIVHEAFAQQRPNSVDLHGKIPVADPWTPYFCIGETGDLILRSLIRSSNFDFSRHSGMRAVSK
jgi:hypothetical protein